MQEMADKGVAPWLLDRNFVKADDEFNAKLKVLSWDDASRKARRIKLMTAAECNANLERIQACRPLGRPGTTQWEEAFAKWNASR